MITEQNWEWREFKTVRKQHDHDYIGVSVNGKIVAEKQFEPLWKTKSGGDEIK